MNINIKQLLKDMQRNVDYAFERGKEIRQKEIIEKIEKMIEEFKYCQKQDKYEEQIEEDNCSILLLKRLLSEIQDKRKSGGKKQ